MNQDQQAKEKRTYLITGACSGIGMATAIQLAERGARIIVMCHNQERAQLVLEKIVQAGGEGFFVPIDLENLDSVREAAEKVLALDIPLHVIINNAGVAGVHGTTEDGFEIAFGINYLAHYLLTNLLLPKLLKEKDPRVINIASITHERVTNFDFESVQHATQSILGLREYGVSKLANVMFTKELAYRYPELTALAVHPGYVATNIWRKLPTIVFQIIRRKMITPEEGAKTVVYCATSSSVTDKSGSYITPEGEKSPNQLAENRSITELLWQLSSVWTQVQVR